MKDGECNPRGLDREFMIDHLTIKTYPKPGMDVYLMRIYYKGAYLAQIEVDGLELEMWRYKDNPDPDTKTYDEFEEVCEEGMTKQEKWMKGIEVGMTPTEDKEENGWD